MIRAVLFDWGDTLMRTLPHAGPMASWPEVSVTEGAHEALERLQLDYRLAVATNAGDSDGRLVRQALERGSIKEYFAHVFTARDLRASKPDASFFTRALKELACTPREAVMVGDKYDDDVIGAKRAGLWTVWFNPENRPVPAYARGYCDRAITSLSELPAALAYLASKAKRGTS